MYLKLTNRFAVKVYNRLLGYTNNIGEYLTISEAEQKYNEMFDNSIYDKAFNQIVLEKIEILEEFDGLMLKGDDKNLPNYGDF